MRKNYAVIGASGLVGSALMKELDRQKKKSIGTFCMHPIQKGVFLDVENNHSVEQFFKEYRPKVVFLPAAIAGVDLCESSPATDLVNIDGMQSVIGWADEYESQIVYFSSGYVFDGKKHTPYYPDDNKNPINRYGRQKLTVEESIKIEDSIIIRTIGIFGNEFYRKNFACQVLDVLSSGRMFFVPHDQTMNPIHASDLARWAVDMVDMKMYGIYHVAGDLCMTKYEFARSVAHIFRLNTGKIIGVSSEEMKQLARRPEECCLADDTVSASDFVDGLGKFRMEIMNGS